MKQVRMLGLSLLAVFAIGALTAGAASAAKFAPEWGFCNKVAEGGRYTDAGCTLAAKHPKGVYQGSYEWQAYTSRELQGLHPVLRGNGVFKFETASGQAIECNSEKGHEWEFAGVTPNLKLEGCENEGQPCYTPSDGGFEERGEITNAQEWIEEGEGWSTHYGLDRKGLAPGRGRRL